MRPLRPLAFSVPGPWSLVLGLFLLVLCPWSLPAQPANVQADPTTGALFRPAAATFISGNSLLTTTAAAAAYQPLDADLTSWAAVTRASGFDTFTATPSGANLASLLTSALPASKGGTGLTALGTGVATALGINTGSTGAFVTFDGALGTPASGTVTNLTGTASININGTVGATTPAAGAFTTLSTTGAATIGATGGGTLNSATITSNGDLTLNVASSASNYIRINGPVYSAISSTGTVTHELVNSSNTASATTELKLTTGGTSAQGAWINFTDTGTRNWFAGFVRSQGYFAIGTSVTSAGGHALRFDASNNLVVPNGTITVSGTGTSSVAGPWKLAAYIVSGLPAASSNAGALAYVTDANATTRHSTVAGGGANKVIVYSDGSNWLIL